MYELDRLLRVHRVPATARRSIVWEELSKADISDDNLKRVRWTTSDGQRAQDSHSAPPALRSCNKCASSATARAAYWTAW